MRLRRCSEKARQTQKSCLSASSLRIGKTSRAVRLSDRRASYWTGRSRRRASLVGAFYVTNAAKHFKFEPRGKRRLHKRPNASKIKICRRWLFDEIESIGPRLIVALGATAAQGLAGRAIPVQSNRGAGLDLANGLRVLLTFHPSALLRLRDEDEKRFAYANFVNDLRSIERLATTHEARSGVQAAGQRSLHRAPARS